MPQQHGADDGLPVVTGKAWVFMDFLRASEIVPPAIDELDQAVRSLLRDLDNGFAERLTRGDLFVGGSEFACGDGGAWAARVLRRAGLGAVIARSFAPEFAREAFEIGLPAVIIDETQMIHTGDRLRLDIEGRRVVNLSSGDRYPIRELTEDAVEILRAGGADAARARKRSHGD